jgi:transposase
MKSYPVLYRERVIALTYDGMTTSEIAEVLDVSGAWVRSIKKLHRTGNSLEPKSRANKRQSLAEREGQRIRAQIDAKPSTTLEDLKRDLNLNTSISNLWKALHDLKLSLKKKRSTLPSKSVPT